MAKHALAGRVVDARNPGRKLTRADQTMNLDAEYSRYEVRMMMMVMILGTTCGTALTYFARSRIVCRLMVHKWDGCPVPPLCLIREPTAIARWNSVVRSAGEPPL